MRDTVYLDWNATAPMRPAALAAMTEALAQCGNPSSVHNLGRLARRRVEDARERIAAAVNARAAEIVFTAGGTEAINLALRGSGRTRILVSAIEHEAVLKAAPHAAHVRVGGDGLLDLDNLERLLAADSTPALVSVMLANNETGIIQPVAEAARIAHAHGALFHCDAVQALGKMPIDVVALDVDYLSLSAHKAGGPQGVGALVVRDEAPLAAQIVGGGQERWRRAGTENVAGIVGFCAAVIEADAKLDAMDEIAALRAYAEQALLAAAPGARVLGAGSPRLPNTICLVVPGMQSATMVMKLDLAGIAVSAGSACSSGKAHASHVLQAMGVEAQDGEGALRISLGWSTTPSDIDRLIGAWRGLWMRPQNCATGSVAA